MKIDHKIIADLIQDGSKVLDLGCGDGSLLESLIKNKNVTGMGVDNWPEGLNECMSKGLPVLQFDLNKGLQTFKDQSFDYVVLNMTLQAMYRPDQVIKEMIRVGKKAIVGFPNFGHYKLVLRMLFSGRMPKTKTLPYEWYDTPNIKLMTIQDFRQLCIDSNVEILKQTFLNEYGKQLSGHLMRWRASEGIFLLEGGK